MGTDDFQLLTGVNVFQNQLVWLWIKTKKPEILYIFLKNTSFEGNL